MMIDDDNNNNNNNNNSNNSNNNYSTRLVLRTSHIKRDAFPLSHLDRVSPPWSMAPHHSSLTDHHSRTLLPLTIKYSCSYSSSIPTSIIHLHPIHIHIDILHPHPHIHIFTPTHIHTPTHTHTSSSSSSSSSQSFHLYPYTNPPTIPSLSLTADDGIHHASLSISPPSIISFPSSFDFSLSLSLSSLQFLLSLSLSSSSSPPPPHTLLL
jgi:hypothetical protein